MKYRNREWRRQMENEKVIKRLKARSAKSSWWRFHDICGIKIQNPLWSDFIGTQISFFYKCSSTSKYDTKNKVKWGKKGKSNYDWSFDPWTRPKDKKRYKKELNELGFKHIPTQLGCELEY